MASRRPRIDLSPDGRLGALVLGALFGLMIIPAADTQVVYLTSYSYYNNHTNTIYPGWNTKVTVTGETFNVSWTTPYGFKLEFETVENNYPWLSYITPTGDVDGNRTYDRAALCQPLVTKFGPVDYINSTKMMQDYAREELRNPLIVDSLRNRSSVSDVVKEFIPECGFFIEYDSLRGRMPSRAKRLNGEYYVTSGFFILETIYFTGAVRSVRTQTYGPIYFNMNFCGHYCDDLDPTANSSIPAVLGNVDFYGMGCYANPQRSVYCQPLEIHSGLGVQRAYKLSGITSEQTNGGRDLVNFYIGGVDYGFTEYSQINTRFEAEIDREVARNETMKEAVALKDPKARYRPVPFKTIVV